MLFKKKKADDTAAETASKEIEYSPEELQLINNLVEDFSKAPGQVDIPTEDFQESENTPDEENVETETAEEEKPSSFKPKITPPAANLDEFDDLTDMDLDSLESTAPESAEEKPEEEPPEEDLGLDTTPEITDDTTAENLDLEPSAETSSDDLELESLPETSMEDLDLGTAEELSTDDFGMESTPELPSEDLGLESTAETPTEDFGLDVPEMPADMPTDDFDFGNLPETAADDLGLESAAPESSADDLVEDLGLDSVPTELPSDDFGLDNLSEAPVEAPRTNLGDDFGLDSETFATPEIPAQPAADDSFNFDDMAPPSLDDITPDLINRGKSGRADLESQLSELADEQTDDEISDQQLNALRHTLKSFTHLVRQNVIDVLLGNKLNKADTSELIAKLIEGASESEIKNFLENKIGKKLSEPAGAKDDNRKVVVSRKQYTDSGIERQEKLLKFTKVAIIAIPLILTVSASVYLFGIKKYLYLRDIKKGKEIIMSQNFSSSDVPRAEEYFNKALDRYPENSYAFLQFADAYRRQGLYDNAFEKLFGKVKIKIEKKAVRFAGQEINNSDEFWTLIQKVPIVKYKDKTKTTLMINDIPWKLEKPGAYIKTHLDREKDEAIVLYALGEFHSSPARKFVSSPYRNNRLGIDYLNRILNFKSTTPLFERDKFISRAILGIGDVYYYNGDYNRAHDYFEKIIRKDPYDVDGQTGMMKTLIKMYESPLYQTSDDPRLIIQQHSLIKHTYKIEKKLPLFMLAKLARFYIDLPDKDDLRIDYNTSPVDKVNNKALKSRAEELLNIMYNKTDEDIYGNKIYGNTFAEGYYQRGRYFRYVVKEYRMAMTQFEYAYKYDPNHFMALNDRAEILMELNDYESAKKHLLLAEEKIEDQFIDTLGDRPEDETLLEADRGLITFNLAKSMYLSHVKSMDSNTAWLRIQETGKFENSEEHGKEALITMLDQVDMYLDKAENQGIKSDLARSELSYYRGWINYVKSDYAKALFYWQSISPSFDTKIPNLELAKSYALYYLGIKNLNDQKRYLETSLSHLFYLQSKYAPLAKDIAQPVESKRSHDTIYSKMAIIENNMGAIYEILGEEENALKHYQQSIEYSKKINKENEVAHLNIRLSFKRENLESHERFPLIMDFISPYLKDDVL